MTYSQIYENIWGDISSGGESTAIGYHICNLRDKLYDALPDAPFEIRCVRELGGGVPPGFPYLFPSPG